MTRRMLRWLFRRRLALEGFLSSEWPRCASLTLNAHLQGLDALECARHSGGLDRAAPPRLLVNLHLHRCPLPVRELQGLPAGTKGPATYVDLKWKQVCQLDAMTIAECLATNPVLEKLDLSWNELGKAGEAIAAAVERNGCLKELILNETSVGDGFAFRMVRAQELWVPPLRWPSVSCARLARTCTCTTICRRRPRSSCAPGSSECRRSLSSRCITSTASARRGSARASF